MIDRFKLRGSSFHYLKTFIRGYLISQGEKKIACAECAQTALLYEKTLSTETSCRRIPAKKTVWQIRHHLFRASDNILYCSISYILTLYLHFRAANDTVYLNNIYVPQKQTIKFLKQKLKGVGFTLICLLAESEMTRLIPHSGLMVNIKLVKILKLHFQFVN